VRPVTFGYLPVYNRPHTDDDWERLSDALRRAGALGIDEYERVRDDLIDRVIEATLRRLATIDPASCSVSEWNSATHLDVMSMHDTMTYTARRRHLPRTPTRRPAPGGRRAIQPRRRHRSAHATASPAASASASGRTSSSASSSSGPKQRPSWRSQDRLAPAT
jgi:hypothetical protein